MADEAFFKLKLSGGLTEYHQFEAYDGFTSLAGAAWTLSLITNYIETGEIRHRGNFVGRHAVRAMPMRQGSLIAEFAVSLQSDPATIFGAIGSAAGAVSLMYGLANRVISRNIGITPVPLNAETEQLLNTKGGDVEALVAATEPSLRQAHEIIGNGADKLEWVGGFSTMANFDAESKEYIRASIPDHEIIERDCTITGFFGNSGNGSVWDETLGRNVAFSMKKEVLENFGSFFSWGLHQYIEKTGLKVRLRYTRILAIDGRPKRYIVISAKSAPNV